MMLKHRRHKEKAAKKGDTSIERNGEEQICERGIATEKSGKRGRGRNEK